MLLQFRRSVDPKPLALADLAEVKQKALEHDSPLAKPITSLVGELVLGTPSGEVTIDARWVASIQLSAKPSVQVVVRVPSPLPQYPALGSDFLELELDCESAFQWNVTGRTLPWFEDEAKSIRGALDGWLSKGALEQLRLTKTFPLMDLGVCTSQPGGNLDFRRASFGLIAYEGRAKSSVAIVFFPFDDPFNNNAKGKTYEAVALSRFEDLQITPDQKWRERPVVVIAPLAPVGATGGAAARSPWVTILQWRKHAADPSYPLDHPTVISAATLFDRVWTRAVRFASVGVRAESGGQPWWPLPEISVGQGNPDVRPLFLFGTPGPTSRETRLIGVRLRSPTKEKTLPGLAARFDWVVADTVPGIGSGSPNPGIAVESSALELECQHELEVISGWQDEKVVLDRSVLSRAAASELAALADERADTKDPDHLGTWALSAKQLKSDTHRWLSFGSVEIRFEAFTAATRAEMNCVLRGTWDRKRCDVYPEMTLSDLPCRMRLSSSSDELPADLVAAFDTINRTEDELHRPTPPIVGTIAGKEQGIQGFLTVRVKAERGRNAVIELHLRRKLESPLPDAKRLYIRSRPFSFARVSPPQFDAEAGTDFAYWRSDDPEGPQWRLPDANVELDLPPQSVAEEMERGNRFWPGDKSYIVPTQPLNFRFSPPTNVTVRPSEVDRRYNKNANNLSAILDNARVEAFRTELLYPIQIEFRSDRNGDPAVDLAETATFVGRPAPNLPALDVEAADVMETRRLTEDVLPDDLARWFGKRLKANGQELSAFKTQYDELRWMHSANRAQFVSRLAQYHVFDPFRPQRQLSLSRGVSARFRQPPVIEANGKAPPGSMPPVLKPLPNDLDLTTEERSGPAARFLRYGAWGDPEKDGALRAGALHTMEFASELTAVFRNTNAVEVFIDQLAFSVIGATGAASVSFDEGRTTFSVEISDGQVWRIRKIRLGRIAIFWNKAKHVVVYERAVVPSLQFEAEQALESSDDRHETFGWPILRKTEEYIEPIERVREFSEEADADVSSTAFAKALEFSTPRIYVNGAWGHDCKRGKVTHGYEIPLWNKADTSGFYPKPPIASVTHAGGGEVSRAWKEAPEELYFYTNTEAGTGADSDVWDAQPGIDLPGNGPARLPIFLKRSTSAEEVLDRAALPDPRLGGVRRKRFDLPVRSDGPADLQHNRGETQVLAAALDVLSFARTTAEKASDPSGELKEICTLASASSEIAALEEQVQGFLGRLPSIWVKYQLDCDRLAAYLDEQARKLFGELNDRAARAVDAIPTFPTVNFDALRARIRDEILNKVLPATDVVPSLTHELAALLERIGKMTEADVKAHGEELRRQVAASWQPLDVLLKAAQKKVSDTLIKPLQAAHGEVDAVVQKLATLSGDVDTLINAAASQIEGAAKKLRVNAAALEENIRKVKIAQLATVMERLLAAAHAAAQLADTITQFADEGVRKTIRDAIVGPLGAAKTVLANLSSALSGLMTNINDTVYQTASADLLQLHQRLTTKITTETEWAQNKVLSTLQALRADIGARAGKVTTAFDDAYLAWRERIEQAFGATIDALTDQLASAGKPLLELLSGAHKVAKDEALKLTKAVSIGLADLQDKVLKAIADLKNQGCNLLGQAKMTFEAELANTARHVREHLTQAALSVIDSGTEDSLASLASEVMDTAGKGLKLVKAIGSVPELPHLTFNANRVEYLFEDVQKQINTSPFAAKLREIDSGLKELGLAVPVNALANQLLPIDGFQGNFNKVFRDLGGIDFRKLFDKFKLPELKSEHIKIVHGVDANTRTAWAKATVKADYPQANDLFAIGPLAVRVSGLSLRSQSDVRVGLDGTRSTETTGQFRGTWVLNFKGAELVTFRDVTVTLDGGRFHVNVAPDNIELHPSLKFISDISKKIGEKIPPCIEVVRDSRGVVVGARANVSTLIKDPPPMPPVTIGPLLIVGGLGLELQNGAGFVVGAHLSVGAKTAPVYVQIGWLGGGMWLESEARFVDGKIGYRASVGLALGSMQSFNIAGVARGSYALLLFAYASFESEKGGSFRAGFSIQGSARILGVVNAYVLMLLEVEHKEGSSKGSGMLDVEVDISRFYTLKVHKQVEHDL